MVINMIFQSVLGSLFSILITLGYGECKLAPDYIVPCDSTEQSCLIRATQAAIPHFVKGIPELGVPSLDPFVIDRLSITLAGGLKVTYINGKVSGFKNCIADKIISELDKKRFILGFHCNITVRGQYTAKGRLLLFPIDGDGDAKIKLTNLRMTINMDTFYKKDAQGLHYFGIKEFNYDFDYGDKMTFVLTNLFKGNAELSNAVLTFMNDNWRIVATEFGQPIVDYAVDLALNIVKKFFNVVPFEELMNVPFTFD